MQNQKTLIFIFIILCFTSINSFATDSFKEAIAKHKKSSLTLVPKVGEGLPFFTTQTLTPTWQINDTHEIVEIPDFTLLNDQGKKIDKTIFDNKISIVGFIFTSCAGFCPVLIQDLKLIEKSMVKNKLESQFVVFSVDPEVDTPEKLRDYARLHKIPLNKNWIFVTGKKDQIYNLARDTFASEVRKLESPNSLRKFAHTEHFYVIDQQRRLRSIINGTRLDITETAPEVVSQLSLSQSLVE